MLLPISVSAIDSYSVNFIIPSDTTVVQQSSSGGGSGGATGIIYESISPPMVSVNLKDITSTTAEIGLTIKNEGKIDFEYGYLWNLEKYNETSKGYISVEKRRMSKFLKSGELSDIPITFNNLERGKYNFNVNVEYGTGGQNNEYISKASVEFNVGESSNLIQTTPRIIKENIGYTTVLVVGMIGIVVLRYKLRFRVRK